jgi:hypothetical protein
LSIHGTVQHAGRADLITAQAGDEGRGLPVTPGGLPDQPPALATAAPCNVMGKVMIAGRRSKTLAFVAILALTAFASDDGSFIYLKFKFQLLEFGQFLAVMILLFDPRVQAPSTVVCPIDYAAVVDRQIHVMFRVKAVLADFC